MRWYQLGVWGWDFVNDGGGNSHRVWTETAGLNNVGLLVTTWGKVTYADTGYF